jgi:beta-glucuronidase
MKIKLLKCCLFTLFLIFKSGYAEHSSLIINVDNRKTVSLDGNWEIIIDPFENGFYNYRYEENDNGYFKNQKQESPRDLLEYEFNPSNTLAVPGDWNSQRENLFFYEGTIWYKKSFDYTPVKKRRLFLYFGGVNYHSIVYLNGEKLGEHTGGFTPFNFEITGKVNKKNNYIVVKVDNKRVREGVPTVNTDWWNYGGITRSVRLIETPDTYIRDYYIHLSKGMPDQIEGWIQLDGNELRQNLRLEIPEINLSHNFKTGKNGYTKFTFSAKPELWSPESPKLYDIFIKTGAETLQDKIGFRNIQSRGHKIYLNGKPVFLRGISIHEQAPIREGRAFSEEDAKILLGWAKELGCNFVRLAHYPHNENMIRLADKMGIMVWSEIPVYWTILWGNASTYQNAVNQLRAMITRDKNRAAITIWSVANETPRGKLRFKFLTGLIETARKMDPIRLISAATELDYHGSNNFVINDSLAEYLDVIGVNEYAGWYDNRKQEQITEIKWETNYDKPLIISEFGGGALYGYHGTKDERWTEEFQEALYINQIKMLKEIDFLSGMSPWILMDFRSPRRPLPGIQDFWNRKGLISNRGEKKKAFFILKDFYKKLVKSQK